MGVPIYGILLTRLCRLYLYQIPAMEGGNGKVCFTHPLSANASLFYFTESYHPIKTGFFTPIALRIHIPYKVSPFHICGWYMRAQLRNIVTI